MMVIINNNDGNNNIKHSQLRQSRHIIHLPVPPVQIRHTQLARGARNQQNLEVNEHALEKMVGIIYVNHVGT
jgi:hypothetical protein